MNSLLQDLRYAVRACRNASGYSIAAVLLLALGIGATTTVFSVVYGVLLKPLPYPQPGQLVRLVRPPDSPDVTVREYKFWKDHAAAYSSMAAHRYPAAQSLDTESEPLWIQTLPVTPGFLHTLGIQPALGRDFTAEETAANGPRAILLTDALWRKAFGGRRDIVGQMVTLDDNRYKVAGVLPASFWFHLKADALVPLRFGGGLDDLGANTAVIARFKDGVGSGQAAEESKALTQSYLRTGVTNLPRGYGGLAPQSYQEFVAGDSRTSILLLFGAVVLLLLIACSNLAGLLVARLASRRKEIAVRLALGSSTGRLMRQYLLENIVLTVAGGGMGVIAASWLLQGLLAVLPFTLVTPHSIGLSRVVLLFALGAAVFTNLSFGLAPLIASGRVNLAAAMQSGNRLVSPRQRMRRWLVAGQVALSTALVISAALLIQSLYRLHQQKLGFAPKNVMTFYTPPSRQRRGKAADLRQFESAVLSRMQSLRGVESAAAINTLPLDGHDNFPAYPEGRPEQSIGGTEMRAVTPGYFATMRVPLLRGRDLAETDSGTAPLVIVVGEGLARRWWPQGDAVGRHVRIGQGSFEVVGVVGDTRRTDLQEPFSPTVYLAPAQYDYTGGMHWVLRGTLSAGFAELLQQAIRQIDPRQRVLQIRAMEDIVAAQTAGSRFDAWIFGGFAGLALVLTGIGLYGLVSFAVTSRIGEIGTRMALGASSPQVVKLVLWQGLQPVAAGLGAGLAAAFLLTRSLSRLLFKVRPADLSSYVAVAIVVPAILILASYVPARRATRVDPLIALRTE